MFSSMQTIRDRLSPHTHITQVLAFTAILLVTVGTGITTIHHTFLPAFTGYTGYKALFIAIPLFLTPAQGLVFLYLVARNRPNARLLCLTIMFLTAIGSYLVFLAGWWITLHGYIELLVLIRSSGLNATPEAGQVLREHFLPHIFSALLKDVVLTAYIEALLWDVLRRGRTSAGISTLLGEVT